jgi:hypothetical protein
VSDTKNAFGNSSVLLQFPRLFISLFGRSASGDGVQCQRSLLNPCQVSSTSRPTVSLYLYLWRHDLIYLVDSLEALTSWTGHAFPVAESITLLGGLQWRMRTGRPNCSFAYHDYPYSIPPRRNACLAASWKFGGDVYQ